MDKLNNRGNSISKFSTKLTDILILNLLWVICCLPIITIGASTTALFYVALKLVKEEEKINIVKSFYKSFKENFKQSTLMWLINLVFGVMLGAVYYYLLKIANNPGIFMKGATVLVTILYVFSVLYAYPLMSRYNNSIARTILNSFVLSIRYFSRTTFIIIFAAVLIGIGMYNTITLLILLVFGVGIFAYVVSIYVRKIFDDLESYKEKYEEEISKHIDVDSEISEESPFNQNTEV
jgi:uncharacterized membrane protein YesL